MQSCGREQKPGRNCHLWKSKAISDHLAILHQCWTRVLHTSWQALCFWQAQSVKSDCTLKRCKRRQRWAECFLKDNSGSSVMPLFALTWEAKAWNITKIYSVSVQNGYRIQLYPKGIHLIYHMSVFNSCVSGECTRGRPIMQLLYRPRDGSQI